MTGWEQVASTGGPWALIGFTVVAILTGRLVPWTTLRAVEKRADRWEAVALEAMRQNGRLIPTAEVAVDVLKHIPQAAAALSAPPVESAS